MLRHLEQAPSVNEGVERWEQTPDLKICLHPDAPRNCSTTIVDAHTVQKKGGGLRAIARDGKVYGFKLHPRFFLKRDMRLQPDLIGVSEASTFPGFCSEHDNRLFRALETRPFVATPEQLFLLSFRCVARRLHSNEEAVRDSALYADADRGLSRDDQRRLFVALESRRITNETGLANTRTLKQVYDDRWRSRSFATNGFVIWLKDTPEFVCSSIVDVDVDFGGRRVAPAPPPAHLCFTVIATPRGGAAVWSWIGDNPAAEQLVATFETLRQEHQPAAILRYCLEFIDTPYFAPLWWDALNPSVQTGVIDRMTTHVQPFARRATSALLNDSLRATQVRIAWCERIKA